MKRRSFLKGLIALPAAVAVAKIKVPEPAVDPRIEWANQSASRLNDRIGNTMYVHVGREKWVRVKVPAW